ncbi:hypothetical protein EDD86DRAFT_250388 [Gorgonomyces haynaldii]|nr:hypothetical protein EDD86DRAFT_250388 [Gorgonomyces haynaldii]
MLSGFQRLLLHGDFCFTFVFATFAKSEIPFQVSTQPQVPKNTILYISNAHAHIDDQDLEQFFIGYEGCRVFPSHALVRFKDISAAADCLLDIHSYTNIAANYSTRGIGKLKEETPKRTLHITHLDRTPGELYKLFVNYPGFMRIAFYLDYCFLCFDDPSNTSKAMEEIIFTTKIKSSYSKAEFSPHIVTHYLGQQSDKVKLLEIPLGLQSCDLSQFFDIYDGFQSLSNSILSFDSIDNAQKAVNRINQETNLTCCFYREKEVFDAAPAAESMHFKRKLDKSPIETKLSQVQCLVSELVSSLTNRKDQAIQTDPFDLLQENQKLLLEVSHLKQQLDMHQKDSQQFQVLQGLLTLVD